MDFLKILKPRRNKFAEELISQSVGFEMDDEMKDLTEKKSEDEISFRVDYLGCLPMDNVQGFTPENALKFLKKNMEENKRKTQKCVILISPNIVRLTDMREKEIFRIPILRISSCSMDPYNKNVFSFINGHHKRKTYYAFICDKWKNAYKAAQAIAYMFSQSHENYVKDMQNRRFEGLIEKEEDIDKSVDQRFNQDMMDFSTETDNHGVPKNWVSFED